jgi:hypothetical protein
VTPNRLRRSLLNLVRIHGPRFEMSMTTGHHSRKSRLLIRSVGVECCSSPFVGPVRAETQLATLQESRR